MKAREEGCTQVEVVHNNVAWSGGGKQTHLAAGWVR